ncbi:hypothetical protein [Thiocystis violacea]|uniref:hypothetical protein n=1 Tax=Thiocystis violacea TaxID=13725 RepID=UPI0019082DAA|nr:hypothetical protein [Thiocystis violacea]MBK1722426.1 hypothetical protein [Thiocystis violacea]
MGWMGVTLAFVAPWLAGTIWLRLLIGQPSSGAWSLALGYGYLLGMLGAVAMLYLLSPLGLQMGFWLSGLLLALAAGLGVRRWLLSAKARPIVRACGAEQAGVWAKALTALVLAWLVLRLLGLAAEVWWQPLFPWDAWTTWFARARVWSETGELVAFVSAEDWLRDPSGQAYSIAASAYPKTVSLLALWPTLGYGAWNETAAKLPWLACFLALGLGFYGQARWWGATRLTSLISVWLLLSMPLLDTHVALAGYADLWMAAILGLSAIALVQWSREADPRQAALAVALAVCFPLIKTEGAVWVGLLLPAVLAARLGVRAFVLLLLVIGGLCALPFVVGGVELRIPWLGVLEVSASTLQIPFLGRFELGFHDSWAAVVKNLFVFGNWHLLAYAMIPAVLFGLVKAYEDGASRWLRVELVLVVGSLLALFVLFFFTGAYRWAEQSTSLARLVLHFMPIYVFYLLTLWVGFLRPASEAKTLAMTEAEAQRLSV